MIILKSKITDVSNEKLKIIFNIIKPFKQAKIKQLCNDDNKKESILGEYLLIEGLKKYYNINYEDIEIIKNELGKPFIKDHNIFYSISHSNGVVVCVISRKEIGVDIEEIKDNIKAIKLFANLEEQEYITKYPNKIKERLIKIYTLKEAYVKMQGTDLSKIKDRSFIIDGKIKCCDTSVKIKSIKEENYYIGIVEKK